MRFSILWRLGLSFIVLILFSFVLGFKGIGYIKKLNLDNQKIYEHPFEFAKNSRDVHVYIMELSLLIRDALEVQKREEIYDIEIKIDELFLEINKHNNLLEKALLGERVSYAAYLATLSDLKVTQKKLINFMKIGEKEKAQYTYKKNYKKYEQRIIFNIMALAEHADETAKKFHEESLLYVDDALDEYTIGLSLVSLLGVLFLLFAFYYFVRPIRELKKIIEFISLGNTSHDIEGLNREDELGDIARAIAILNENTEYITKHADKVAKGNYTMRLHSRSEEDKLGSSMQKMTQNLLQISTENEKTTWLQNANLELAEILREELNSEPLGDNILKMLVNYTSAQVGTLYMMSENILSLSNAYAYTYSKNLSTSFSLGEGLIGQVAQEDTIKVLTSIPDDYIKIESSLGNSLPTTLILIPFSFHNEPRGVIELGYFGKTDDNLLELLQSIRESIAIAYDNLNSRVQLNNALSKEQRISEELQAQEEELRVSNERLQEQSARLIHQKDELEKTGENLEKKAEELENASRYKSEFLANMSHELRTPLNSLLILSRSLADNDENHLSEDEVESANVIQESGKHLLSLINDILDISKVEAGQMVVSQDNIETEEFISEMNKRFLHMAKDKNIEFSASKDENMPHYFRSDRTKLGQIITNFISNALKFTLEGGVSLFVEKQGPFVLLHVKDTGIGIPKDKQETIFEAFKQADGSTTRNFGGTGLGLSIALKFSELLDGHIEVQSEEGKGSHFTLAIPLVEDEHTPSVTPIDFKQTAPAFKDDRDSLDDDKLLFLIIEDDEKFAKILYDTCVIQGNQAIVASDGETGILLAKQHKIHGILLDYMLPGLDGSDILGLLKSDASTKNIPVHIMTAMNDLMDMKQLGAIGQLTKPVSFSEIKNVLRTFEGFEPSEKLPILLVDNEDNNLESLADLLQKQSLKTRVVYTYKDAVTCFKEHLCSSVVVDISHHGFDFLEMLNSDENLEIPPVIVYSEQDLSEDEQKIIDKYSHHVVVKSSVSNDRLLDEVRLFTNHVKEETTYDAYQISDKIIDLEERHILLVDDDMRNTYSLAKVFRSKGLKVQIASSGKRAIEILESDDSIDIILMDIMMPNMDGYETTRAIREIQNYKEVPILAVTAKAMKGDKEKCLDAGANDYLSKPIDMDKLFVMLQMWL